MGELPLNISVILSSGQPLKSGFAEVPNKNSHNNNIKTSSSNISNNNNNIKSNNKHKTSWVYGKSVLTLNQSPPCSQSPPPPPCHPLHPYRIHLKPLLGIQPWVSAAEPSICEALSSWQSAVVSIKAFHHLHGPVKAARQPCILHHLTSVFPQTSHSNSELKWPLF